MLAAAKQLRFLDTPMKTIAINAVVTFEVFCWFYVGEMIGRRSVFGYRPHVDVTPLRPSAHH